MIGMNVMLIVDGIITTGSVADDMDSQPGYACIMHVMGKSGRQISKAIAAIISSGYGYGIYAEKR
jgi:hypothetical protein